MAFSNGQTVQAADLNNFSVTTVTTSGAATVGGALAVTGAATTGALTAASVVSTALVDLSGAAAGQVKFPAAQNASSDANTLDDYEEGSWTPVLGGSTGTSGQTYGVQVGSYTKVGRLVHAQFTVTLTVLGTISGVAQISGLPFTSTNTSGLLSSMAVGSFANLTTSVTWLAGLMQNNATTIQLRALTVAAASAVALQQSDFANTTSISGSIVYLATT